MANKVRVNVVKKGEDYFVQPPVLIAEKTDSFRIINSTKEDLAFYIADTAPLQNPSTDQTKIVKAGKKAAIDLHSSAPDGSYEYSIVMLASGKKAVGNSDPVLIIDN